MSRRIRISAIGFGFLNDIPVYNSGYAQNQGQKSPFQKLRGERVNPPNIRGHTRPSDVCVCLGMEGQ